ncbi:MAG TPA: GNAT family N-acetyltransferase [Gemmatimonadaceae bacterium]|nr:GNAT family N-acetyltransferase [Gemmatimonadaceae bacterium]
MHIGQLRPENRARLAELLVDTGAFHADEVEVALSLFDLTHGGGAGANDAPIDYEFVGAFEGDQLVGYACFGPTPATEGTFDLYWLAVDPAAQGRGIGRALVRDVEEKLIGRGGRLLVVETSSRPDYAITRQFYVRSGYTEAARVRDFYAPADDRILLTTRLTTRDGGAATR